MNKKKIKINPTSHKGDFITCEQITGLSTFFISPPPMRGVETFQGIG